MTTIERTLLKDKKRAAKEGARRKRNAAHHLYLQKRELLQQIRAEGLKAVVRAERTDWYEFVMCSIWLRMLEVPTRHKAMIRIPGLRHPLYLATNGRIYRRYEGGWYNRDVRCHKAQINRRGLDGLQRILNAVRAM